MSNTKNNMTQAAALRFLIDHASEDTPSEVIETAEKLYSSKTKKYTRNPNQQTKTQILNNKLAHEMVEVLSNLPEGIIPSAKNIAEHWSSPDVRSPQKVVAIAKVAEDQGLIRRVSDKKQTYYIVQH